MNWKSQLSDLLPSLGHRNWIIIADAAYPLQTSSGLVTWVTDQTVPQCLSEVMELLNDAKHVRPVALLDEELSILTDAEAPGVGAIRLKINQFLKDVETEVMLHDHILPNIAEASETYTIVVIKTSTVVPYTSVFLRLECGYWNEDSEKALRERMS